MKNLLVCVCVLATSGPREFATVDLLTGTANSFSTATADVLENFYDGADSPL